MLNNSLPLESRIQVAMEAADSALLLASSSDIARASKAWRKSTMLGIDTEFVRERTYYAQLGLVQISDGQTVWLVDPMVPGSHSPIRELLENNDIVKVIHSPSEDLDVLQNTVGALPSPMIDTQLACALLGQPLQLAYHAMVHWLLDVSLENEQTRSNWMARPLKPAQLHYAALDVCLLPMIWQMLEHKLESLGRLDWLTEDCNLVLKSVAENSGTNSNWMRVRGVGRLDGESLAIFEALYAWRENQARTRNLPRGFIIKDPVLLEMARVKAVDMASLESIEDIHPGALRRHGESILKLIRSVRESGKSLPVMQPLTKPERNCLADMRSLVGETASDLGIEPAVLASRRDLEGILRLERNQWPAKIRGWRGNLIGDRLEMVRRQCIT